MKGYRHLKEKERLKIYELLFEGCSLQGIADRIGFHKSTIYRYIYSSSGKKMKLHRYLRKKRLYRYPRIKRKRQKANLDKESIHMKSDLINKRLLFGHWEGDLVLFQKTRTNLFTLRERKTRFLVAIKNANRKAKETSKSLINYMGQKVDLMESLTLDNDPAFAEYQKLSFPLHPIRACLSFPNFLITSLLKRSSPALMALSLSAHIVSLLFNCNASTKVNTSRMIPCYLRSALN